ncbi:MAG: hypothetical protein ACQERZ_04025 [Fusobacteriota bacterium]
MDFNIVQAYISKMPELEDLLENNQVQDLTDKYSRELVEEYLQKLLDNRHKKIVKAKQEDELAKLDFSFDYYIKKLKKDLVIEKGRPIKKVINCLGTVYSQYIGERLYTDNILDDFKKVFGEYNNLELDEEKSDKIELDQELKRLFNQILNGKEYILVNNMSSAVYLAVESLYKDKAIYMNIKDNFYLSEGIGIQDIIERCNVDINYVGYINRVSIDDYKAKVQNKEELIINSDIFENDLKDIGQLSDEDSKKINQLAETMFISNKVYLETDSLQIEESGLKLKEILENDYNLYALNLSKLSGTPDVGLLIGDPQKIKKIKENKLSKIFSVTKESKVLLYLILKAYLEKKYNDIYINNKLNVSEEELKDRNKRFARILEREVEENIEINFIKGDYLKISDNLSNEYTFPTELVHIKPKNIPGEKLEKNLRCNDPSILCWMNNGALMFNLQLITEEDEDIIIDKIVEFFNK